jgi:hypothetical protein
MNGSNETNEASGASDIKETEATNDTNNARMTSGSNGTRNGYRVIKETDLEPVPSQRSSTEDGKEYTLTTERANAIARWVQEAPVVTGMSKRKKRPKKADGSTNGLSAKVDEAEKGIQKLEI